MVYCKNLSIDEFFCEKFSELILAIKYDFGSETCRLLGRAERCS